MEFEKNKWVKPFSTGMTCLDTISGECLRGLSKDECKKVCEDSPYCDYGYHVTFPHDSNSYCVPINNIIHFDSPYIFQNSLFDASQSPVIHKSLGVDINVFQEPVSTSIDASSITQHGVYMLSFMKNQDTYYLCSDFIFRKDMNKAVDLQLFKDYPVISAILTNDGIIKNGEVVFIKDKDSHNIILYLKEELNFLPYSLRAFASPSLERTDLYHTQIITDYNFDHQIVTIDQPFAIRVAQIPVDKYIYYFTVDEKDMKLKLEKVSRNDIANSFLENYKIFKLEKTDEINPIDAENFIKSQRNYLLQNYYKATSKTTTKKTWVIIVIVSAILIILLIMYVIILIKK